MCTRNKRAIHDDTLAKFLHMIIFKKWSLGAKFFVSLFPVFHFPFSLCSTRHGE